MWCWTPRTSPSSSARRTERTWWATTFLRYLFPLQFSFGNIWELFVMTDFWITASCVMTTTFQEKTVVKNGKKVQKKFQWFAQHLISHLEAKTKQQLIFNVEACSNKKNVGRCPLFLTNMYRIHLPKQDSNENFGMDYPLLRKSCNIIFPMIRLSFIIITAWKFIPISSSEIHLV